MEADGGLVQHIEDAGRPVADRAGQLDPLPLARGQGRGGPVQGQVAQAQVHQAHRGVQKGLADIAGHGPHGLRQRIRHSLDPGDQVRQGHGGRLVQADPPQSGRPGRLREPGPAAGRAGPFLEEALDPLHALFVPDLGEGIFHRIDGVKIGEVHFRRLLCLRIHVKNMLLFRGAVVDDLLFLRRQVLKGHIRPDSHLPAHVLHEGPHQGPPDHDRSLVDRAGLIGHQGRLIDRARDPGPPAGRAGARAVEGQVLRPGPVKARPADRADRLPHRGHIHGRLHIVAVGAAVAGQAREHEPQAVEELRHGPEGAPDPGDARPLVQGQGCRHIADVVHMGPRRLRHPPSGVGRQRLQIPARPLRVQNAQGQGGLARSRYARYGRDLIEWNIHIDVFQIVYSRSPHLHAAGEHFAVSSHAAPQFFKTRPRVLRRAHNYPTTEVRGLRDKE